MQVLTALSYTAIVSTIGLFLTGIPVTRRIKKARSSANVSYTPYLAAMISTCLWLKYGILTQDYTLISVNGIGFLLNFYYVVICYSYSKDERAFYYPLLITISAMFGPLLYVKYLAPTYMHAVHAIGYCGCITSTIMFGSPLATLGRVLRTKSTESMVFSLCLMNFIVSVTWALYGYVINDIFVQGPNAVGALLGLVQLLLFVKYPSSGGPGHVYDLAARLV
ncbi:hypothetical protein PTSG_08086 [Salpingoeca rosetta]|uniref:Sugar transporter SWEET1 n=1 Tax=Salpingoeca rosetta (strain ATCC 50818 / BSB-021) TaxID=946362 RepID=F2UHY6_SALR5|nr:uncharacterized protein PTSG_08086 [Salpingoeca rosetta]EGD76735.1 hypothetical protein PTSG_08086 [Salpingoeca rosetta]|eukprot:XP_004991107.1 hypothetical protein PTSG_08086 [Salpingoeca rosetta]